MFPKEKSVLLSEQLLTKQRCTGSYMCRSGGAGKTPPQLSAPLRVHEQSQRKYTFLYPLTSKEGRNQISPLWAEGSTSILST